MNWAEKPHHHNPNMRLDFEVPYFQRACLHCGLKYREHRKAKLVWIETKREHTARLRAGALTKTTASR